MTTASLYLRLSGKSSDTNTGLDTQRQQGRALADRHGLTVVAEHLDDGKSGALRTRPAFREWLADARQGRATHLLALKFDRVGRAGFADAARIVDVVEGVDQDGIPVSSPVRFLTTDGIDSAIPGWEFRIGIESTQAKGERSAIVERVHRHRAQARARGQVVGGRRLWPFTAETGPEGWSVRRPIPERAQAIRDAAEDLRAGRTSLHAIAYRWNEDPALQPNGSQSLRRAAEQAGEPYDPKWSQSMVRRVLENPGLYGATNYNGEPIRNDDGTVRIDPDAQILTLGEWNDLQAAIAVRSKKRDNPSAPRPALLAGLLHCSLCGRVLRVHRPASGANTYRCPGGRYCPRPIAVAMFLAEEYLEDVFRSTYGDQVPPAPARTIPQGPDADELATVEEALRVAEIACQSDDATPDDLTRRKTLRVRLGALRDAQERHDAVTSEPADTRTYAERYDAAETVPEKTALLSIAFDRLTLHPGERGGRTPISERITITADPRDYV